MTMAVLSGSLEHVAPPGKVGKPPSSHCCASVQFTAAVEGLTPARLSPRSAKAWPNMFELSPYGPLSEKRPLSPSIERTWASRSCPPKLLGSRSCTTATSSALAVAPRNHASS